MGSIRLDCPLCCSETFSSCSSLKYHLLSIIDNLICPGCSKRFDKIIDLVEHLECCEYVKNENGNDDSVQNIAGNSNEDSFTEKNDITYGELINDSILAKALLTTDKKVNSTAEQKSTSFEEPQSVIDDVMPDETKENETEFKGQKEEDDDDEEEEDSYYCSGCGVSFLDIKEHLEKYHEGHAVLLDESVDEAEANDEDENQEAADEAYEAENGQMFYVIQNDNSIIIQTDSETHKSDSALNSTVVEAEDSSRQSEDLRESDPLRPRDTIQEEECYDKDGRLYTRKVVKIKKFWEDKPEEETPLIENYLILGNKAVKLNIEEVGRHRDKSKIVQIYQCRTCPLQSATLGEYFDHKCSQQSQEYKCSQCSISFVSLLLLILHGRCHQHGDSDADDRTCKICNTDFPSSKSLNLHKRMHDPIRAREVDAPVSYNITGETRTEPREKFTCEICHKSYDMQYKTVHMNYHNDENNFNCDVCNRKFFTKTNLEMHMSVHSNEKKFICSYCKRGFLTYDSMSDHIANQCHRRRYECQYCGRRFARPHEKVKHERIHTGEKPHACEVCGKTFRVSYCLTLHMRTHSGTRPYHCQFCGKRFKAHSVYNHHLLTHSDERNYKCPYCPKAFKTGVQLAGHKNSHTKPFTCTECNRPFASLYAVRSHMEIHKRQNNLKYSCWICGATYARTFALRDHMKEKHPNGSMDPPTEVEMLVDTEESIDASNSILVDADETMLIELNDAADVQDDN